MFGSIVVEPAVLLIGIALTAISLTVYYHLHRWEKHQDVFLISFVGAGAVVGYMNGMATIGVVLSVAPWCAIVGLLMSTYGPRLMKT